MRNWLQIFCFLMLSWSALADEPADRLTVVELFTSQGCSSCPPADAALRSLRGRPGLLTLSWPVDYWDRLGWEDTLATPMNAVRQAAYNKRLGRGGVFTPQMVFDGRLQCVGSKNEEIHEAIKKARSIERPEIRMVLMEENQRLLLQLSPTSLQKMITVHVVWYMADVEIEVGSGENRGRKLHYTNVVRASDMITDWDGKARIIPLDTKKPMAAGADHVAVLLQEGYGHGPIVGANRVSLFNNSALAEGNFSQTSR